LQDSPPEKREKGIPHVNFKQTKPAIVAGLQDPPAERRGRAVLHVNFK
jgi:hypothetical protein